MSQNFVKAKQDELQGRTGKANKGQPGGNSGSRQDVNNKNMNPNNQGIKGQDGLATSHVQSATRQSNNDPVTSQPGPQQTVSGQTPPLCQNQGNSRNSSHGLPPANKPGPQQSQGERTPLQFQNHSNTQNPNQQRNHPPDSQVEADQTGSLNKDSTTGHGNQDQGHGNLTRLQQEAHTGQGHNTPSSPEQNGGQQLQEYQPESGQGPDEGQKSGQHDPYGQGQGNNSAPDKTVQLAWEKLVFQLIFLDDGKSKVKPVVFDASKYLDKVKVQFALTYSLKFVTDSFRARNKEMTLENDAIVFEVKSSVYGNMHEMMIKDDIVNDFKEIMIDQLHVIEIPFENEIAHSVLVRLKQGVPVLIEHKKVAVYKYREKSGEVYLEIVGVRIDCEKLLKELQVDLDEVRKLCHFSLIFRDDECDVLEALKFEERIKNKYQGVINMDVRPITMDFSTFRDKRKVQVEGRQFLTSLFHENVNFEQSEYSDCIRTLLFDVNGRLNQAFSELLNKKLIKGVKQLCQYYMHLSKDNNDIIVICSDKSFAKTVCRVVEKTVHMHRGNFESDEAKEFLSREEGEGKLKIIYNGSSVTAVVCTNDLSETICKLMAGSQEVFVIPPLVCQLLKDHGYDIFIRCKKGLNIEISVENEQVKIDGQKQDVKKGKKRFKNEITSLRRSLPDVPKLFSEMKKVEMGKLMTDIYCYWKYKESKRDEHEQLKNCEYLVTWYNPSTSFKVTAVRGDPKDLAVDNYVMFVSQSLHPVGDQSIDKVSAADLAAISSSQCEVRGKTWNIEEVQHIGKLQGLACKDATGLVVVDGQNVITLDKFVNALVGHFKENDTYKNVVMQTVTGLPFLSPSDIAQGVVRAALSYFRQTKEATLREVLICCTEETEKDVTECINFALKVWNGFGKKIHNDEYTEFENEEIEDPLEVFVCTGSLPDIKADILVNTTSKDLDLEAGMVSKTVLKIAGKHLKEECKNKYPNGIKYGEIAVTSSHKMAGISGVKYIFHGALPYFKPALFKEALQLFIRRCLFEAELYPDCTEIAFPALGVGKLEYPRRDTARIIFDAVEEFRHERISRHLQKIMFVVYEKDKETCQAFKSEEWRRSKQCLKDLDKSFVPVCSADRFQKICLVKESVPHIEVLLGSRDELGSLPSHVVECQLSRGTSNKIYKPAMVNPITWNDMLEADLPALSAKKIKEAVKYWIRQCQEFRISEISLNPTFESELSVGEQVCIFATVLCEYEKKDDRYLQRAYIMVPDSAGMQSVESHSLIGDKFILKTPEKTEELGSIEMIGKTEELVDEAKLEVQKLVRQFKEEMANLSRMDRQGSGSGKKSPPEQPKDERNTGTEFDLMNGKHASGQIQKTEDKHLSPAVSNTEYGGARPKTSNTHDKSLNPCYNKSKVSKKEHEKSNLSGAKEGEKTNPSHMKDSEFPNKIGHDHEGPLGSSAQPSRGNNHNMKAGERGDIISKKNSDKKLTDVSLQSPGGNPKRSTSDKDGDMKSISEAEEDDSEEEIHLGIGEVSAEFDQDAINILKRMANWDEHLKDWKVKFNVQVKGRKRKVAVTSFEKMVQFENYLEEVLQKKTCDNNDQYTMFEKVKEKVSENEYNFLKECFSIYMPEMKDCISYETQEFSVVVENEKITGVKQLIKEKLHELRTARVFEVMGLKVKVYKVDITSLDFVDCFGVVAQPTLRNVDGIAMKIAKKLCGRYQGKCDMSIENNGQLSKGECRIIECEETGISVANMHIPHYQETREKQLELLKYIEEALCNCLIKSNELKKKVLALPFIGSGKQKYPLIQCSQEYVRAIQRFIKDYKHENRALREVHFVGLKEDDVKSVVTIFKDELKVNVSRKTENTKQEPTKKDMVLSDVIPF